MPSPFRSLSSRQRHAFAACFLGWSLDAFDYFILVFCVSAVAADFHVAASEVAEALFLTLAFRPVGAFLFGTLADRFGRRPTLMFNIACYSLLELACAFAGSMHTLLILRALFGIAMGGEWGVGAALAFETLPKENRGFFSGLLQEGYAVGYLMAAAAYALLFPWFSHFTWHGHDFGWRGMFLVGAAPALLVFYIGGKVEESPTWREGRALEARTIPGIGLKQGLVRYAGTFVFLVLLMTGFNSFSHGTQDLYPTFLQKDHGFSAQLTGAIAILYNIGALTGGMVFGSLSERIVGDYSGGAAGSADDSVVRLLTLGGGPGGRGVRDAVYGAGGVGRSAGVAERVVAGAGAGDVSWAGVSAGESDFVEECGDSGEGGGAVGRVRRGASLDGGDCRVLFGAGGCVWKGVAGDGSDGDVI